MSEPTPIGTAASATAAAAAAATTTATATSAAPTSAAPTTVPSAMDVVYVSEPELYNAVTSFSYSDLQTWVHDTPAARLYYNSSHRTKSDLRHVYYKYHAHLKSFTPRPDEECSRGLVLLGRDLHLLWLLLLLLLLLLAVLR